MKLLIQQIVIILVLISYKHEAVAQSGPYGFNSLVAPVNKHTDTSNPLYSVYMYVTDDSNQDERYANFLIDLDAPLIWHDCNFVSQHKFVHCDDNDQCGIVQSTYAYKNQSCPSLTKNPILSDWGYCGCTVTVANPITGACEGGLLNYDFYLMYAIDGRNPIADSLYISEPIGPCTNSSSSFQSFPKDVTGVMSLSSSPYSLLANSYKLLKRVIALCLPSTSSSAPGVLFLGTGPYYFSPHPSVDVSTLLSYTPLIKHPDSFGYFINVNAIVIKNRSISITATSATTKLSTIEPYTTLRTDIYNQVIRRFLKVTKRIPTAKPIAPFNLCYNIPSNDSKVGLKVPDIGFSVQGGKTWTISTANSMKQVTKDTACLAFVDGGATSEPAIVIGTFQFEENLVVFDLQNSTFGFSSSLLHMNSSCSNFNFTIVENNF